MRTKMEYGIVARQIHVFFHPWTLTDWFDTPRVSRGERPLTGDLLPWSRVSLCLVTSARLVAEHCTESLMTRLHETRKGLRDQVRYEARRCSHMKTTSIYSQTGHAGERLIDLARALRYKVCIALSRHEGLYTCEKKNGI